MWQWLHGQHNSPVDTPGLDPLPTHATQAAAAALKGAHLLLHAGDVGHYGGHAEVLKAFADATCTPVLAVAGNVDDDPGAAQLLPPHRTVDAAGWKLLLVHIVAPGPGSKGVCVLLSTPCWWHNNLHQMPHASC